MGQYWVLKPGFRGWMSETWYYSSTLFFKSRLLHASDYHLGLSYRVLLFYIFFWFEIRFKLYLTLHKGALYARFKIYFLFYIF